MTDTLWTAAEIGKTLGGQKLPSFNATGISIDTRSLQKGDIFVALKGENLDGHSYVDAAFKAGAIAAIVDEGFQSAAGTLIHVRDTQQALEALAMAARARSKAKIIGVAGSVGKTGTKELLAIGFTALGKTHASKKSFNNHIGVPLTLSNLPADADFGVFEIGMNHSGEISKLTQLVRPHIALITTIEPEHVEFFNSIDEIADANAEIFESMRGDTTAILNADNPYYLRLKAAAEKSGVKNIIAFGEDDAATAKLLDCSLHADSIHADADIMGEKVHYKLNIPGQHIAMNALGALTVIKAAGGNLNKAIAALKNSAPVEGRGNRILITLAEGQPPITIINETYNANPASMQAAFKVLEMATPTAGGRRIAVLGDMLELGKDGPKMHAELANPLLKAKTDIVYCCGLLMDALYQMLPPSWQGAHTKDSKALAEIVASIVKPGDVILIKGSNGSKMSYVVQALQALSSAQGKQHAV